MYNKTGLQVITTTPCAEARPLMEGVVKVPDLYPQLRKALEAYGAYRLFSKPVTTLDDEGRESYQWMTDLVGEVESFNELAEQDQEVLLRRLQVEFYEVEQRLQANSELDARDKQQMLSALDKAFEVPTISALYRVGDRPVLTQWGHLQSAWDAPSGILRQLIAGWIGPEVAGCVWVQVLEPMGTYVSHISVSARDDEFRLLGTQRTDPSGVAKFTGLEVGQHVMLGLTADVEDAVASSVTASAGTSPQDATATLILQRERSLWLRLCKAPDHSPWGGVEVVVEEPSEGAQSGYTDAEGCLKVERVPIGATQLGVRAMLPDSGSHWVKVMLNPDQTEYTLVVRSNWRLKWPLIYGAVAALGLAVVVPAVLWAYCLLPLKAPWCLQSTIQSTIQEKVAVAELPRGTRAARVEVYVEPGASGVQVFTREGDHIAGAPMVDSTLDELSQQERQSLLSAVHEQVSGMAKRYNASGINNRGNYNPDDLNWTEHGDIKLGFSGPASGGGVEIVEVAETDQRLFILASRGAKTLVARESVLGSQ